MRLQLHFHTPNLIEQDTVLRLISEKSVKYLIFLFLFLFYVFGWGIAVILYWRVAIEFNVLIYEHAKVGLFAKQIFYDSFCVPPASSNLSRQTWKVGGDSDSLTFVSGEFSQLQMFVQDCCGLTISAMIFSLIRLKKRKGMVHKFKVFSGRNVAPELLQPAPIFDIC